MNEHLYDRIFRNIMFVLLLICSMGVLTLIQLEGERQGHIYEFEVLSNGDVKLKRLK